MSCPTYALSLSYVLPSSLSQVRHVRHVRLPGSLRVAQQGLCDRHIQNATCSSEGVIDNALRDNQLFIVQILNDQLTVDREPSLSTVA